MSKEIPLTRGKVAIVDDDWFDLLMKYKWYAIVCGSQLSYARRSIKDLSKRSNQDHILMHRFIVGAQKGQMVDHINGNSLDNRACNLRLCDSRENQQNSRSREGSSSRYKGVNWSRELKRWKVAIRVDDVQKHLGYFVSEREAAKAYNEAADLYYGEFAKLNIIEENGDE